MRVQQGRLIAVMPDRTPTSPRLGKLDKAGRELLFTKARTAKAFASDSVTDEELVAIWELSKWGPSSGNIQPLRVLFVWPGPSRERLLPHLDKGNQAKTSSAPAVAVLAVDTQFEEFIDELVADTTRAAAMKQLFADETVKNRSIQFNGALQAGYFIMATRAMGFAAGPMLGFNPERVDAEFFPDGRWRSILLVNIGHPAEKAWPEQRPPRLDRSIVLRYV
jgi:3-hydroxypropanoate dehydrogenase